MRWAVGAIGVLLGAFGAWTLLSRQDADQLVSAALWLVVGVVLHDGVIAVATLLLAAMVLRRLPWVARAPAIVGFVVLGSATLLAVPVLGRFGARPDNATLLDRGYLAGWVVLAALTVVTVIVASVVRARSSARLITTYAPDRPEAVVLVLHGGASRPGRSGVRLAQLSVLRMVPVARRIARAGHGRIGVLRLLNTHRGWDTSHTPVDDVVWALRQVRERYGEVPIGLVGHSLGGRAALLAGGHDGVRAVVALNPWVYPTDHADLSGRAVLVVHGTADRVADPRRARVVADAIAETTDVTFLPVEGGRHAMLGHGATFERAAADFVLSSLLGERLPWSGA